MPASKESCRPTLPQPMGPSNQAPTATSTPRDGTTVGPMACHHTGTDCTKPATGHNKTATVDNLCGRCTFIQCPKDFKQIWKLQRDPEKERASKDRKEREKKKLQQPKPSELTPHSPVVQVLVLVQVSTPIDFFYVTRSEAKISVERKDRLLQANGSESNPC
jgi:hypothetical protein